MKIVEVYRRDKIMEFGTDPDLALVLMVNKSGTGAIVVPVKSVSIIPLQRDLDKKPWLVYVRSRKFEKSMAFANTMEANVKAIRMAKMLGNPPPEHFLPFEYVPSGNFFEINLRKPDNISTARIGRTILELTEREAAPLQEFLNDRIEEHDYTLKERVKMYLEPDEFEATHLTRWSKRKRAALKKLLGKFNIDDMAKYFGVSVDVINSVIKRS